MICQAEAKATESVKFCHSHIYLRNIENVCFLMKILQQI